MKYKMARRSDWQLNIDWVTHQPDNKDSLFEIFLIESIGLYGYYEREKNLPLQLRY
ncbi:MAG: hypothetical protein ACTSUC_06880 [Promethearchaeota archaeon]